ncbi:protein WVD2-like 7 [Gastrolobium bilobum]|uniref:protein WVD2-like 7 n=1 Tax=Gastrolobium bilobum TaxID=150636 RepID=UPI002AB195C3|nr:protein WVD2-like 7 [Gastrolobium bilobum]
MGDSTCFMQPFCYASGISNEANESNPIHALGQSISFGRFMSESLAWEKWSSFSHNRYVEEAERFSRPGSVAQKKAFFEAHYKKLAAQKAALLEQANNASQNNATGQENVGVIDNIMHDSQISPKSEMVVKEEQDAKVLSLTSESDIMVRANEHDSSLNVEASIIPESNKVEEAEPEMEQMAGLGNSMKVELQNLLEDVHTQKEQQSEKLSKTPPIMTPIMKLLQKGSNFDDEVLASMGKKKPPVSSIMLLKANGTSKFTSTPVKSTAPISFKRDNNIATPMSNKPAALSTADKERSTHKSLQMSVNFTPIRELNRLTASVMRKFESTRVGAGSSKASKDSLTPLRTPTMASKEMQKHSSLTPLTEKKRNKMRSPIISSPFSLRTEERAARRKKKLEEKFNADEAQKVQLHTKLKEKAEIEIRKLRQSLCFKARPLPDFYNERKASKNETRKDPLKHTASPKGGRKHIHSGVAENYSLPPNRPSLKNNGTKNFQGKGGRTLTNPLENTSPNIQHGNQNDRSYK